MRALITCHFDPLAPAVTLEDAPALPLAMGHFLDFYDAIAFARRIHAGQKRANGRAFFSHPLAVLQILRAASNLLPHAAYVAAILHDTVEDGRTTVQRIRAEFGADIADAVGAITRTALPEGVGIADHEREYLDRMTELHARLPYVLHIKMADRLHNLETVQYLPAEQRRTTLFATTDLYLPLLRREAARQTAYAETYELLLSQLEASVKHHAQKPEEAFTMR